MPIEKEPILNRLRGLENERAKIRKWLADGEYVDKGRLE